MPKRSNSSKPKANDPPRRPRPRSISESSEDGSVASNLGGDADLSREREQRFVDDQDTPNRLYRPGPGQPVPSGSFRRPPSPTYQTVMSNAGTMLPVSRAVTGSSGYHVSMPATSARVVPSTSIQSGAYQGPYGLSPPAAVRSLIASPAAPQRVRLACPHWFHDCDQSFDGLQQWIAHIRRHFGSTDNLPRRIHCPFTGCPWSVERDSGVDTWREFVAHINRSHNPPSVPVDTGRQIELSMAQHLLLIGELSRDRLEWLNRNGRIMRDPE